MAVSTKLFQLKEWLTIEDAAKQLTILLNEEVSEIDLYQLSLDGRLTISVYFPIGATAKLGSLINQDEVKIINGPHPFFDDQTIPMPDSIELDVKGFANAGWLRLDENILKINGIWDLLICSSGATEIEQKIFKSLKKYLPSQSENYGIILKKEDLCAQLLVEENDADEKYYIPAYYLDCHPHMMVVRPTSIMDFLSRLNEDVKKPKGRPSKLSDEQIAEIKKLHKEQSSLTAEIIANQYGVSASLIRQEWN
jgi:hypothetical protein